MATLMSGNPRNTQPNLVLQAMQSIYPFRAKTRLPLAVLIACVCCHTAITQAGQDRAIYNSGATKTTHQNQTNNWLNTDSSASAQTQFSQCAKLGPPALDGYAPLNHERYLDRPDAVTSRVTLPIEDVLIKQHIEGHISGPLSKTFCQISVTRMIVDFRHPVEDDAIAFIDTRAVYHWVADGEMAGWQIAQLGERLICARRRSTDAQTCR